MVGVLHLLAGGIDSGSTLARMPVCDMASPDLPRADNLRHGRGGLLAASKAVASASVICTQPAGSSFSPPLAMSSALRKCGDLLGL